tara:strand:+ start:63 stop:566 length:504 start_codon:yes stop_codon:yes gene_type:complete
MPICKKCNSRFPQERLDMGYNVCVDCSTEETWSCSALTYHKTGNSIEIIKDPEVAYNINQMATRKNFGVMSGVTGRYKRYVKDEDKPTKIVDHEDKTGQVFSSNRKVLGSLKGKTINFENQGKQAMFILDNEGLEQSIEWIKNEYQDLNLSQEDFVKLIKMVKIISK